MYAMKEEDCLQTFHNLQDYQEQFLLHHHPQNLPWSSLPSFDPTHYSSNPTRYPDPVHYFNRRASSSSFDYTDDFVPPPSMDNHHHQNHLRIISEALGPIMRRSSSFGFDGEIMGKMSAQEVMDAKALAASKSHSEAERRRRERINTHLAKLRSILPNTTKTKGVLFDASLLWLWVLVLLTVGVGGSTTPLLTIMSPDGDIVDCIIREYQPAFQHPLLKNHKLQEPPLGITKEYDWQVWHKNGTKCPEGSIPIRKVISNHNETSSSNAADRVTRGHEYVIGSMRGRPKIYGTQVTMNVWLPHIERSDEFSLGQIWLTSGSYDTNDINTIEAGWQVFPSLYHDYQPRFFIYWTTDAYNQTGCYNIRCGGFVQTSRTVMVEGAISRTSIYGGAQSDLTIRIWKDQKSKSWWLGVVLDHGVLEPIGYWPAILFTKQTHYAEQVQWGGEIINSNITGQHTKTQMGSGYFPDSGLGNVAYMRNLEIAFFENDFQPLQELVVGATHPHYYYGKKVNNTYFYYGGSEQLKSQAVCLSMDYITLYFIFGILLIF